MVQYETITWAKESGQPLAMLKLDFSKAYDMVSWRFLYAVMERMGLPNQFTAMVKMLLQGASASVLVNGAPSVPFPICWGVRQGCPLAPLLFLLVAEALAEGTQAALREGTLRGITLPDGESQQILTQFADDATFSIHSSAQYLATASELMDKFGLASGLYINRSKCALYWYGNDPPPPTLVAKLWM